MSKVLLVGLGGLFGDVFSRGLRTVGQRARKELGVEFQYYHWNEGGKAGRAARAHKGPVVLIWHSAGKKGSDDFCNAFQRPVALAFALDSWLPNERANPHLTRVYSIKAGRGGRFHVEGNNVVGKILYPEDTHTSIDDDEKLHDFVIEKIAALGGKQKKPKPTTKNPPPFETVLTPLQIPWAKFMSPNRESLEQAAWQKTFFERVRKDVLKPLSQDQVNGIKTLIFVWQKYFSHNPPEFLAFILGNAVRETGGKMTAIREANGRSRKDTLNKLNAWWRSGEAQSFGVRTQYWKNDGHGNAFGRGIFQITHRDNYLKGAAQIFDLTRISVDLGNDYSMALDPLVSSILACTGSIKGSFREGHNLFGYFKNDEFDYYNSRDIINGDKLKVGSQVNEDCKAFARALEDAEKVAPKWLRIGGFDQTPVPVDPVTVPTVPNGELTLANLRKVSSPDLYTILAVSGDAITLISHVLDEREKSKAGQSATASIPVIMAETPKGNKQMAFPKTKHFLKSKRIWGLAAVAIGMFFPVAQPIIDMITPNVNGASPEMVGQLKDNAVETFAKIKEMIAIVGWLVATWGSAVAEHKLTIK